MRQNEVPHMSKVASLLSIFMLSFLKIMQLLVEETNRYYDQYLGMLDEIRCPLPDVTIHEMYLFLAIVLQLGHNQRDRLKYYWPGTVFMAFYGNTVK
jgi:hypothetical protein